MEYSFNRNREGLAFAHMKDINASFKDLSIVCDTIRYKNVQQAMTILDKVSEGDMPVLYNKYNKYMGSRHELGGRKGRYPMKCARIVRKVLMNAIANAENKGEDPDNMFIVHATANKTMILPRIAPKGELRLGHNMGRGSTRRTNLELAKIEMAIGYGTEEGLSERMKKSIELNRKNSKAGIQKTDAKAKHQSQKKEAKAAAPKEQKKQNVKTEDKVN
jgi:large subunit ribosomal protein L22